MRFEASSGQPGLLPSHRQPDRQSPMGVGALGVTGNAPLSRALQTGDGSPSEGTSGCRMGLTRLPAPSWGEVAEVPCSLLSKSVLGEGKSGL